MSEKIKVVSIDTVAEIQDLGAAAAKAMPPGRRQAVGGGAGMSMTRLTLDGLKYRIGRRGSIFTARNNALQQLEDATIWKEETDRSMGGSREWCLDEKRYVYFRIARIVACESGELIRDWCPLPDHFSISRLRCLGFVDHENTQAIC